MRACVPSRLGVCAHWHWWSVQVCRSVALLRVVFNKRDASVFTQHLPEPSYCASGCSLPHCFAIRGVQAALLPSLLPSLLHSCMYICLRTLCCLPFTPSASHLYPATYTSPSAHAAFVIFLQDSREFSYIHDCCTTLGSKVRTGGVSRGLKFNRNALNSEDFRSASQRTEAQARPAFLQRQIVFHTPRNALQAKDGLSRFALPPPAWKLSFTKRLQGGNDLLGAHASRLQCRCNHACVNGCASMHSHADGRLVHICCIGYEDDHSDGAIAVVV